MQDAARIAAVIDALESIFKFDQPADNTLNLYFRTHRYIGSKDRRFVAETVWAVLRRFGRYSSLCKKLTARIAVALYLQEIGLSPDDYFTGGQYAPEPLTDDESVVFEEQSPLLECPDWLKNRLEPADISAMTRPAATDLRVNTLKTTREKMLKELEDLAPEPTPYSPTGIRLQGRPQITAFPAFTDGRIELQDEGSQIAALLTQAKAGDLILDWCAGAGGKTLAMAAMTQNKGVVYAVDLNTKRLRDLPDRAQRSGAQNIVVLTDYKNLKSGYDLVLIDAPCTGTGTWRRSPDARWRIGKKQSEELVKTQRDILEKAAKHVKAGGRLFYITCSLDDAENDEQITAFLKKHKDFKLENLAPVFKEITGKTIITPVVHLTPSAFGTDGFFAASMIRTA